MYPTRLVPPFVGLTPLPNEGPGSRGADPHTGAPPNPAPGRRSPAGIGRTHSVAGLPGQPGALPRSHLAGEG